MTCISWNSHIFSRLTGEMFNKPTPDDSGLTRLHIWMNQPAHMLELRHNSGTRLARPNQTYFVHETFFG